MAISINPIELRGNWDKGFALDVHVVKSVLLGEDVYGHQRFDNTRSPIGELLYDFKYKQKYSNLTEIVETVVSFLETQTDMRNIQAIIPVPPTKFRLYQPTLEIASAVADRMNIHYIDNVLVNHSSVESKALSSEQKHLLEGTITKVKSAKYKHNVLLIDDLYKTGSTLRQCVRLLREDPLVDKIYVLTVTKTKNS